MSKGMREYYANNPYTVKVGQNGAIYVDIDSVRNDGISVSDGNTKVGRVMCFNMPIEWTCDHRCNCYKEKKCYACAGHYAHASNQAIYAENYAAFKAHGPQWLAEMVTAEIRRARVSLFRWFTCGDIASTAFLIAMVETARMNENVRFWAYTKKYGIVNRYIENGGVIPANLTIIFSHWMNDDGTYFPMDNPHGLPTSEFIPLGMEHLAAAATHICPCSDPTIKATCETCEHGCYALKHGEMMALLEHSTARTAARDKAIRAAHKAL